MVWYGMLVLLQVPQEIAVLQTPWYGMVWYGVVWCGVVWYGMVWCGVVW